MTRRVRRSAEEARLQILEAAEKHLAENGPDGVQVQDVAGDVGVVPATVLHHFGSRDGLLDELMTHGAERLDDRLAELVAAAEPDLAVLAEELLELYASRGYATLYASISRRTGVRRRRRRAIPFGPLLQKLEEYHGSTSPRRREELAFAVLALNLVAFAEAHVGRPMRAAVHLPADKASRSRFVRWLGEVLDRDLESRT